MEYSFCYFHRAELSIFELITPSHIIKEQIEFKVLCLEYKALHNIISDSVPVSENCAQAN